MANEGATQSARQVVGDPGGLTDDALAMVAHELRNPLHAILLQVALAKATAEAQGHEQTIARIVKVQASLSRYAQRVTMLLDLASQGAHGLQASKKRVNLPDLLRALVDQATPEARSRGIVLSLEAPDTCQGWTDPVMLEQIIENLMLNAFKHAQCSTVVFRLRCEGGWVRIDVTDNGRGISPEDHARIFGKYSVARHTGRGEGTGLGLWIVRRLVDLLGGRIDLTSTPGAGTTFSVRFPASEAEELP